MGFPTLFFAELFFKERTERVSVVETCTVAAGAVCFKFILQSTILSFVTLEHMYLYNNGKFCVISFRYQNYLKTT